MTEEVHVPEVIDKAIDLAIERDSGPKAGIISCYTAERALYDELHCTRSVTWIRKWIYVGMRKRGYVRYSRGSKTYGPHFYRPKA